MCGSPTSRLTKVAHGREGPGRGPISSRTPCCGRCVASVARRRKQAGGTPAAAQNHQTRERILIAALKLVSSKGYAGTSIAMICREAGLNASSLYWFFKNKEDLLLSAIKEAADEFLAAAALPPASGATAPAATLEVTIKELARQLHGKANFLRLLLIIMIEERDLPAEVRNQIAAIRASSIDWWRALLERHFADLGATNARLLAADFAPLCRATINGAFIAQQYGEPLDLEIILEQLFLLLSGLRDRISAESVVPPLARKRSVTAPRKGVARP